LGLHVDGRGIRIHSHRRASHWDNLRQSKVQNPSVPVLGYKNVRRLDVAVNNALGMRRIQSVGDFDGER
jgi:hypothetical protein